MSYQGLLLLNYFIFCTEVPTFPTVPAALPELQKEASGSAME